MEKEQKRKREDQRERGRGGGGLEDRTYGRGSSWPLAALIIATNNFFGDTFSWRERERAFAVVKAKCRSGANWT